jgi:hypothetical protein
MAVAASVLLTACGSAVATAPTPAPSSAAISPTPMQTVEPVRSEIEAPVTSASLGDATGGSTAAPTRVEVPSRAIDVDVRPTGVKDDGEMEIPPDPSVAGWYRWGSTPDSASGNTVIAAHVDSLEYGLGPFVGLRDLPAGDEIVVTTDDGVRHRYAVESVTRYAKAELPTETLFARDGRAALALITCGGSFDIESRTYSDNVVVIATEI